MRPDQHFHQLVKNLLRIMEIAALPSAEPEVYSLEFAGAAEIHIFSTKPDSIDIVAALGVLKNCKAHETLLRLLAMNLCIREDSRPFNIGLDPDTGKMSLWTKDYLSLLDANKLAGLIREMLDKAALIQQQLQESERSSSTATPGSKYLPRLRAHSPTGAPVTPMQK